MSNAKNLATFLQSGGSIAGDANFDSNTLFVDASANAVGIGTNSPGTKMDIVAANNSQLRIDSSDTNDTTFLLDYNGGGATNRIRIRNAAGDLAFNVSNTTEAMRIDSSGNVGIGNTSAQTRLFVGDGSGTEGITIYSGTTGEGQLRFADGTSGSALYQGRIEYNHSTSKLLFGAGGTTPIAIDSNGNLGIGTISPQINASYDRTIHVHSALGSLIKLTDDTSGSGASDGTDLLNYGNDTYLVNRDVGDIIFNITGSNKMRIDSSGNVGIGTDSPTVQLATGNRVLHLDSGANQGSEIKLEGNNGLLSIGNNLVGAYFYNVSNTPVIFGTNNTERMRINSSGRVDVNDSLLVYNNLEVGAGAGTHGKINSQTPGSFEYFIDKGLDARGVCNGSYGGYLLLVPAYTSGTVVGKKFYGEIIADRGNTGNGNSTSWAKVLASTAYNTDKLLLKVIGSSQYFTSTHKVTYNGTEYLALRFNVTGGEPANSFHAKGHVMGEDSNFLYMARDSEVSGVTSFGTRILDL